MSSVVRTVGALGFLAATGLTACSGDDGGHPAAAAADPGGSSQPLEVEVHCTPDDIRECHHYYVDDRGQLQCPISAQQCSEEGDAWSDCGSPLRPATPTNPE